MLTRSGNAGIAFLGGKGSRVAVVSQEDAAVWVGEFHWEELEFVGKGRVRVWAGLAGWVGM